MSFLLLDQVDELTFDREIVAIKCVSLGEEVFRDHFPGSPIWPGSLTIELGHQAGGILLEVCRDFSVKAIPAMVDRVRLRQPIRPGDRLTIRATIVRPGQRTTVVETEIHNQAGQRVATAATTYRLVPASSLLEPWAVEQMRCCARALLRRARLVGFPPDRGSP